MGTKGKPLPLNRKKVERGTRQESKIRKSISGQTTKELVSELARPSVKLVMNWTPEMQSISYGERDFTHKGRIETDPSHDLAHLIIAANGDMAWAPEGGTEAIKLAEYNAVFLEHLLNNIYDAVMSQHTNGWEAFSPTLTYARWFVESHFAPFPISAEEAYCQFCWHIDGKTIVGLSSYFFEQKRAERNDPAYALRSWALSTYSDNWPTPIEQSGIEFRLEVERHIMRLKGFMSSGVGYSIIQLPQQLANPPQVL